MRGYDRNLQGFPIGCKPLPHHSAETAKGPLQLPPGLAKGGEARPARDELQTVISGFLCQWGFDGSHNGSCDGWGHV